MVGSLCFLLSLVLVTSLFVLMTQHRQEFTQSPQAPANTALSSPSNSQNFVKVCGLSLCLNGKAWYLYGASANGATTDANARMDMAVQGHLNTVRLTDWLHDNAYDESQWRLVDLMIAAAQARGLHILVDLSTYAGIVKQLNGGNLYTYDWGPFLNFVLNRVNTVSGIRYADDPTIALFAFQGEVAPLNTPSNTLGITTQQVNDFFKRTAAEFKAIDKNHLLEPGGLYQLGWNSGVDYKTIFGIPDIDVCAVHAPAPQGGHGNDALLASQYCQHIGKPWIWEEFSQPQGIGDQNRANWFQTVYNSAKQWKATGASFWNLGPGTGSDNNDAGPQTPLTWQTVIKNAPIATPAHTLPTWGTPLAQDIFRRANQAYWGIASDGQIWSGGANSSNVFSIVDNTGQLANGSNSYGAVLGPTATNAQVLFSGSISNFNNTNIGAVLRWTDDNNWYKAYIDGANLVIQKKVNGSTTILKNTAFAAQPGIFYTLRFSVAGSALSAKVWQIGTSEPSNSMVTATDNALQSGYCGLHILVQNGAMAQIAAFTAIAQ